MNVALRWAAVLTFGFILVTLDILNQGMLYRFDQYVADIKRPKLEGFSNFLILRIDDLGLRWFTATILLVTAALISRRFKSWRPLNLSVLAVLALNLVVGLAKLGVGRTKPRLNVDLVYAGGLSYPSGHASNAILTWGVLAYILYRYSHPDAWHPRAMGMLAGAFTLGVCLVSAFRNTHWLSDLLGGLFIGGALLVMVIAVDRFVPSQKQTR
ncbi:MAG: phosphatase PAP2 family protein [Actinobacteria bacterium]|nr:phosphatase PAP2 family protein [Actinomycetota bacterium]